MVCKIAEEFTKTPGPRYRSQGAYSAEEFRDDILFWKYKQAVEKGEKLTIDFDGTDGYPLSWVEEVFGGMVRIWNKPDFLKHVTLISREDETIPDCIRKYVKNAWKIAGDK